MAKLYDKDDPNQVKEEQTPYGDEASDDSSPAALHGRVVRLETNAKHVATNEGIARVEGKIDTVDAKLGGKIDTAKAELKGEINELKSENAWLKNLLYTIIGLLVAVLVKDNQTIANIINSIANFFR